MSKFIKNVMFFLLIVATNVNGMKKRIESESAGFGAGNHSVSEGSVKSRVRYNSEYMEKFYNANFKDFIFSMGAAFSQEDKAIIVNIHQKKIGKGKGFSHMAVVKIVIVDNANFVIQEKNVDIVFISGELSNKEKELQDIFAAEIMLVQHY